MAENAKEFNAKFKEDMAKMKQLTPNMLAGFGGLFQKVMQDGKLSLKIKELIAVSIAVAMQCEPCINLHVAKCLEAGASKEETLEAVEVAVVMQGGPAYTHIPMIINALEDLS